jgi:putative hydrolase of the HAD superfamily
MAMDLDLPNFDCALFDAGLTLIHPVDAVEKIYAGYAQHSGIPLEELVPRIRHHFREVFDQERRVLARGADGFVWSDELDQRMWKRLCFAVAEAIPGLTSDPQAWYEQLYSYFGAVDTWRPYPETVQTLVRLRERGVRLGVVSNWDSRLPSILDGLEITGLVDVVVVSAVVGVRKPGARIFELALERLGARPEATIMVGDSLPDDVKGAAGAGLSPVLVDRSGAPSPAGVVVIRSLDELVAQA